MTEPSRLEWDPSEPEARNALRNASLLLGQRSLDVLRSVAFAALVPRLLGPPDFGRFALLMSIAHWFALLSSIGTTQLMGRFVPAMVLRKQPELTRRLLGSLLAVRIVSGSGAAALFLVLVLGWLPDLSLPLVLPVAGGVALQSVAAVPFAFFLGLNQAARWGVGETVRRWSSLILMLGGTLAFGVRGACAGMFLSEVCVLALGLHWVRPYLSRADVRLDGAFIAPYLKYNLVFFGSNLLLAVGQRSGEPIVREAAGNYTEVGYFGMAAAVYVLASRALWQVLMSFVPLLSRLREEGRTAAVGEWASRLLKLLTAFGVVACAGAVLLGTDLVPLLVGPSFAPAAALLPLTALALLFHAAGSVGRTLTLVLDRPRLAVAAAIVQSVVLLGLGVPLARRFGAMGMALATLAAAAAGALAFLGVVKRESRVRLGQALAALALGGLLVPFALLPTSGPWERVGLFLAFAAAYAVALRATRLITTEELAALRSAIRPPE